MRPAPAIRFPVRPDPWWRGLMLALGLLVGLGLSAWALAHAATSSLAAVLGLAGLAGAFTLHAVRALRAHPVGELAWDGRTWTFEPAVGAPEPGTLAVALDAQVWMLLRVCGPARWGWGLGSSVRWLPVRRAAAPNSWHLLRCAVYSRALPPRPADTSSAASRAPGA